MQKTLGLLFILGGVTALFSGAYVSNSLRYQAVLENEEVSLPGSTTPDLEETRQGTTVANALTPQKSAQTKPKAVTPKPVDPKSPVALSIPAISINAQVQAVGVAASGNIAAPAGFSDVGWYKYGAAPGEVGTVIIDGHVDNGLFRQGVFKHLDRVKEGDTVTVSTGAGKTHTYIVSGTEVYDYKSVPMQTIVHQKDSPEIVLITCAGDWIAKEKTYTKRLIVYATLKDPLASSNTSNTLSYSK